MNKENKEISTTNVIETNTCEDEIILASPTELFDMAEEIAKSTQTDEKFPFTIHYDANQKDFLLSLLQISEAIVEDNDEENHLISALMNMRQMTFIKHLDCTNRISTDEGLNPFLTEEIENLEQEQFNNGDSGNNITGVSHSEHIMTTKFNEIAKVSNDTNLTAVYTDVADCSVDEELATASVDTASVRSSCSNCPTNTNMAQAQEIAVEDAILGRISCPGAKQWFKFNVPKTGNYTIYTTGTLDTVGELYDCNGSMIARVDDYEPCGKLNFRIICHLNTLSTYYICVSEASSNTGRYYLEVTEKTLPNSIYIKPSTLVLEHIGKVYELPILPNIFTGVNGAEPLSELSATPIPSTAYEKRVKWSSSNSNIVKIDTGWHNNQRYQTLTVVGKGTAKLYAYDWEENGKRGECTVNAGDGWPVYPKPHIHAREYWGARDVVADRLRARTREPERIIFHHPAENFSSTDFIHVIAEIQRIQNVHIDDDRKCDIAYHFIIDPAGGIWQGAEVDEYQRGHAEGHFDDIGVVILGDFEKRILVNPNPNILNDNQKNAMRELSKWLCYEYDLPIDESNNISPITTHRAVVSDSVCPGENAAPWVENDLKTYINNWHP